MKKSREIFGQALLDGGSDEQCGVMAVLRKVNTRPLGIGGTPAK